MIAIYNTKASNNKSLQSLILANTEDLALEKDGYSTYRDGKIFSTMNYDMVAHNIAYQGERLYMTHFRQSTGGSIDESGLHLQRLRNRYIFAHNGTTKMFVKDRSDSWYFFNNLTKREVTNESINQAIDKHNFWGKGFLYDEVKDQLHIFSNSFIYITILDGCLVFSSFDLEMEAVEIEEFNTLGYWWYKEKDKTAIPGILHKTEEQDYYLLMEKGTVKKIGICKSFVKETKPYKWEGKYNGD